METKRNIKYTSDGKKVVVIGNLNSQETIVQEIFIIEGQEVPSGENFVVKSLHDAPAVSWYEKETKAIEERYRKEKSQYEYEIERLKKSYYENRDKLRDKLYHIGAMLKDADETSFENLVNYLTGKITHVVIRDYRPEILTFDEFEKTYDEKLRLISIYGKDANGDLKYAQGSYSDYSGGQTLFYPFTSYEKAHEKVTQLIQAARISDDIIERAKKYDIELDAEKLAAFKVESIKSINEQIKEREKQIEYYKVKLENYKD